MVLSMVFGSLLVLGNDSSSVGEAVSPEEFQPVLFEGIRMLLLVGGVAMIEAPD